jgi:hypothetical protein
MIEMLTSEVLFSGTSDQPSNSVVAEERSSNSTIIKNSKNQSINPVVKNYKICKIFQKSTFDI